ncbi:MAG: hypothetical protein ACI837_003094 [Crocinitomicaceae bacterium]|jgi:uncharacterized protein YndB with AHSA1/START domain
MNRKLKRAAVVILTTIVLVTAGVIIFSPYHKHGSTDYRTLEFSIEIDAPVDSVYAYLGDSDNAEDWSIYVDHISALNSNECADGAVGAKRRCFQEANEEGIIWDEQVVEVIPSRKRRLTIYNLKGFSVQANGLETEQIYEVISPNKTRLTFTVFYGDHNPSAIESLKMYYASYEMYRIFKGNLERVKFLVEEKEKSITA